MRETALSLLLAVALLAAGVGRAGAELHSQWVLPDSPETISADLSETSEQFVALTFDDGPDPQVTPRLLDALSRKGAKASFFVVGRKAERNPELIGRMLSAGHTVGNHTMTHPVPGELEHSDLEEEIVSTNEILQELGAAPRWFRPPYGSFDRKLVELAEAHGLHTVLWSVDPQDWREENGPGRIAERILQNTGNGAVILLHSNNPQVAELLPGLIERLHAAGYRLVTLDEWARLVGGGAHSRGTPGSRTFKPGAVPVLSSSGAGASDRDEQRETVPVTKTGSESGDNIVRDESDSESSISPASNKYAERRSQYRSLAGYRLETRGEFRAYSIRPGAEPPVPEAGEQGPGRFSRLRLVVDELSPSTMRERKLARLFPLGTTERAGDHPELEIDLTTATPGELWRKLRRASRGETRQMRLASLSALADMRPEKLAPLYLFSSYYYDPAGSLARRMQLPEGAELLRFSAERESVLVLRAEQVAAWSVPSEFTHLRRLRFRATGWRWGANLSAGGDLEIGPDPVVLGYAW